MPTRLFQMLRWDKSLTLMFQRDGTAILENVSLTGTELPGCQGRLQNPGKRSKTSSTEQREVWFMRLNADQRYPR